MECTIMELTVYNWNWCSEAVSTISPTIMLPYSRLSQTHIVASPAACAHQHFRIFSIHMPTQHDTAQLIERTELFKQINEIRDKKKRKQPERTRTRTC